MESIRKDFKSIKNKKVIFGIYLGVAILCYGYAVTHSTIGIDDMSLHIYFTEGLAPAVGRWTLFLLNRIFNLEGYVPWFTDTIGVLFLLAAVCIYFFWIFRLSQGKIRTFSYIAFGTIFLSSPFICEVFIYQLHNGVGLSFLLMALTGLFMLRVWQERKYFFLFPASICLALAVGCYESFAVVYLTQGLLMVFLEELYSEGGKKKERKNIFDILLYIIPLVAAVVIRAIVIRIIAICLDISLIARGASGLKYLFRNNPFSLIKNLMFQFILRYIVNGKYIFGVAVFAISMFLFLGVVILISIKRKNFIILFSGLLMLLSPWVLVVMEFKITAYRAGQALMLLVAACVMVLFEQYGELLKNFKKLPKMLKGIFSAVAALLLVVIVYNQAYSMNEYFYFDYQKYENDVRVCSEIADEIIREHDINKPVAYVGTYEMPESFRRKVYLSPESEEYQKLCSFLHYEYRDCFYEYVDNVFGYGIYDVAGIDPLSWMTWASLSMDSDVREVYHFNEMLGFTFKPVSTKQFWEADNLTLKGPVWPKEGSITETEDMIIVRVGN